MASLCGCALWGLASAALAQGVPTFSSRVEVVKLDVSVTRGGRPVEGLGAADFEVIDDGVRQEVELLEREKATLETVLLLDTSQSVAGRKLVDLKEAVGRFVEGLGSEDRASLITFASQVRQRVRESGDRDALLAALGQVEAVGMTSLCDALLLGLAQLRPGERRPVLVVFTDGADLLSWLTPEEVEAAARRSEAVVYVVSSEEAPVRRRLDPLGLIEGRGRAGLGSLGPVPLPGGAGPPEQAPRASVSEWLEKLAIASGGIVFRSRQNQLTESFLAVLEALKNRYLLRYQPSGVDSEGWHGLKVRTLRKGGDVKTREGYFAVGVNP